MATYPEAGGTELIAVDKSHLRVAESSPSSLDTVLSLSSPAGTVSWQLVEGASWMVDVVSAASFGLKNVWRVGWMAFFSLLHKVPCSNKGHH